ncbi:MAG: carotenoid biosynthesis protein [Ignavibacteria bacterium]|nr:carotenoid biosynthesis protein [Ignavibacteria bacterium]
MQTEHQANRSPSDLLLKVLTGILIVMFPVGFIIMFTEFGSAYLWTTTIFLGLEALITFILLIKLADLLSVVITTAVIFMASWFVEYWGVTTGFPFGDYTYSGILAPHIGGVPLAIMFAWFTVTACSLFAARYLLKASSEFSAIVIASIFVLATDILLEPFASFVNNYWVWQSGAVPLQNFVSWFAVGIVFVFTISQLIKWNKTELNSSFIIKIPLIITAINILNFSVVNVVHGYYVLTAFGLAIFTAIIVSTLIFKPKS